jgi:ketosteroid isomerase-like protein
MKIRLLLALIGLAISFALPTFAQQTNTPDPQLRQMIDAFAKKYTEAINKNDAAAVAALYAEDGVFVADTGPIYGREAIKKMYADLFQKFHFSNNISKADQYSPHSIGTAGNATWETGEWSVTLQGQDGPPIQLKGYYSSIDTREGDAWMIRMVSTHTTSPPPSNQ